MAELEGEALLIGKWKNVAELEECLNLDELRLIISASREKEHRHNKFMAALKGIDLDENEKNEAKERFEAVQRRAQARLSGASEEQIMNQEFTDLFGTSIEIEE